MPDLKKARPWFADIDSTALQQNVKRLDTAYKNFFKGRGFPQFKNKSNFTSYTITMGVKIQGNKIYFPKIGWMRLHLSRPIPDGFTIKAATIRRRQNGWYVSVRIEDKTVPTPVLIPLIEVKSVIGLDMGLTKLVHLSDHQQIKNHRFLTNKKTQRIFKIRQRRVNRKKKGSKNRKKAAQLVGKFHQKITNKRTAYQWNVANQIVKKVVKRKLDAISLEDLNISGMSKRCRVKVDQTTGQFLTNGQKAKQGLNKSIADASWAELISKIEYMAGKSGKIVMKVNPQHTSQECPECKHTEKANRDQEKFICVACGFIAHADIKAAKTIRDRGLEIASQPIEDSTEKVPGDSRKLAGKTAKRPLDVEDLC